MDTINWGIIGCGDVTEKKSGPALQLVNGSKLAAVMRRNGQLAKDYAIRHQVPRWYDQADQLIADPEINAIYIATPPAFHKEYTLAAAKAGKVVYVEKPMALNYAECLEMINACEQANVPLFVAYYRRALPRFLKVKELLDSGAIGQVSFVTTSHYQPIPAGLLSKKDLPWRLQPHIAGGGLFYDLASHTLDLLDFLFGPIEQVNGFASNHGKQYEAEDIVTGRYLFHSGVHGIGVWCFTAGIHKDVNEIVGTKGSITFSTFGEDPIRWVTRESVEEFQVDNPTHIQQPLIESIVKDLLVGELNTASTGKSAARTNRVMDEMVKNYYHVGK